MNSRPALWIFTIALMALALFLVWILANPASAADEGDIGCVTVTVNTDDPYHITTSILAIDEGVRTDVVGHYLWLQYAHTTSSTENNVSWDLSSYETGTQVTACTTYIAEGAIPEGPGTARQVELISPSPHVIITTTLEPHPTIADAWITNNGLVAS